MLVAAPGAGAPAPAAAVTRLERSGYPVFCGGRRSRDVALTFDDGPGPYTTLAVRILRRDGARATFFLVGKEIVLRPTLPLLERRVAALGDHTWNHVYLPRLTPEARAAEIDSTKAEIARVAHVRVRLFRPPYGARSPAVDAAARAAGLLEVLWSIDSRDWAGATWTAIAANVLTRIRPGSIVLMHENHGQTIRALRYLLLPGLQRRGLHPVTLPALLAADPPTRAQLRAGARGCVG